MSVLIVTGAAAAVVIAATALFLVRARRYANKERAGRNAVLDIDFGLHADAWERELEASDER